MAEKKKTNIEKYHEKRRLEKLKKEGKLTETEAKQAEEAIETDKPVEAVVDEIEKLNAGQIKCKRCEFVFDKARAVNVPLFGKLGCPKCGHSIA